MSQPYHQTERCFRLYETYIIQALISYPSEVRFVPERRSIKTDTARCRDAITSWRENKWDSALDPTAYAKQLRELTVWESLGHVCLGPKRLKAIVVAQASPEEIKHTKNLIVNELKEELLVINDDGEYMLPQHEPKFPHEVAETWTIEEAVEKIDSGDWTFPLCFPNTPDNLALVISSIGERLNVVYVINKEGDIQIF